VECEENIQQVTYGLSTTATCKSTLCSIVEHNSFFCLHDLYVRQSYLAIRFLPTSLLCSCHKPDPDFTDMKAVRYCMQSIALPNAVSCRLISSPELWQKAIFLKEWRQQICTLRMEEPFVILRSDFGGEMLIPILPLEHRAEYETQAEEQQ
jgi:hypothetical protein